LPPTLELQDAAAPWTWMSRGNGHVRRLDAALADAERTAVLEELASLAVEHRRADGSLGLPRAMTLVTASAAVTAL
jgi:hypothetical protein